MWSKSFSFSLYALMKGYGQKKAAMLLFVQVSPPPFFELGRITDHKNTYQRIFYCS